MTVRLVAIGDVAIVNPKETATPGDAEVEVPFIPMAAVHEDGSAPDVVLRRLGDVKSGYTFFERGDILLAKITPCFQNGKGAFLDSMQHPFGFGSTEFHVLRAGPDIHPPYLYHAVRTPHFRNAGTGKMTGSAGQQRIPARFISAYKIPLPSHREQRRIAAMLDKADVIQRKRRESIKLLDEVLRSAFLEMFGDPVRNEKGWQIARLGDVALFTGGGTPSRALREFYTGPIPWASSKDITSEDLLDTQEHVTPEAIEKSATRIVPIGSILIVVKSKILLHRLPVAIARTAVCFSQDIKAITPCDDRVPVTYLARHLRVGQQALLNKARGANTEGLTLEHLRNYQVMLPPPNLLKRWDRVDIAISTLRGSFSEHLATGMSLFDALAHRAFQAQHSA